MQQHETDLLTDLFKRVGSKVLEAKDVEDSYGMSAPGSRSTSSKILSEDCSIYLERLLFTLQSAPPQKAVSVTYLTHNVDKETAVDALGEGITHIFGLTGV